MKKLDKVILVLFSVLIFLQSILVICTIMGWVNIETVETFATMALTQEKTSKIILGVEIVCLILSMKCIFADDTEKDKKTKGVLMQNDNGKLLISKSTIENIVISVVKGFDSVEDISCDIEMDNLNSLIVNVKLAVSREVIIKELTVNMQNKIKEAIKRTSDLEVKEVNVKINNIITNTSEKNKQQ